MPLETWLVELRVKGHCTSHLTTWPSEFVSSRQRMPRACSEVALPEWGLLPPEGMTVYCLAPCLLLTCGLGGSVRLFPWLPPGPSPFF